MRRLMMVALLAAMAAAPSMAQDPSVNDLYAHCEKTLDEGTAAVLFQKQRADSLAECLAQARAAYGLAAKDAALAGCRTT